MISDPGIDFGLPIEFFRIFFHESGGGYDLISIGGCEDCGVKKYTAEGYRLLSSEYFRHIQL